MDQPAANETDARSERDRRDLEALGLPVLANLVGTSDLGIALLDGARRWLYVNPAGCRIMGAEVDELIGRSSPFVPSDDADTDVTVQSGELVTRFIDVPAAGRALALEYAENGFVDGQESRTAVMFRDVTETQGAGTSAGRVRADRLEPGLCGVAADGPRPGGR